MAKINPFSHLNASRILRKQKRPTIHRVLKDFYISPPNFENLERKKFKTIEEEIEELILDAKLEVLEDVTDIHSDDHTVVEV